MKKKLATAKKQAKKATRGRARRRLETSLASTSKDSEVRNVSAVQSYKKFLAYKHMHVLLQEHFDQTQEQECEDDDDPPLVFVD